MNFVFPRHAALWSAVAARLDTGDISHDSHHVYRVYQTVLRLAPEAGADLDLAGAAALVHDLELTPKESAQRSEAAALSAVAAANPLRDAGYSEAEVACIQAAVRTSSWSRGLPPENPEGAVLQDADRLDAIGAIGIARVFACHQGMAARGTGGRLWHPEDPSAAADRPLDDRRYATDHFRRKLLHLAETMHTPTARAEATRRHAFLESFLDELGHETGVAG